MLSSHLQAESESAVSRTHWDHWATHKQYGMNIEVLHSAQQNAV